MREFDRQTERVETGAIRFGEDWPGVFIRGGDSWSMAMSLESLLSGHVNHTVRKDIAELKDLLKSCLVQEREWVGD